MLHQHILPQLPLPLFGHHLDTAHRHPLSLIADLANLEPWQNTKLRDLHFHLDVLLGFAPQIPNHELYGGALAPGLVPDPLTEHVEGSRVMTVVATASEPP